MLWRTIILFVSLAMSLSSFASVQCAAFSPHGLFATAQIVDQQLTLTLPNARAGTPSFSLRVSEAKRCALSFSKDDGYVSVSIEKTKPSGSQVDVGILSLASKSWVNGGVITPKFAHLGGGFIGDSHEVATAFISGRLEQGSSLALQMFTIDPRSKEIRQRSLRPLDAPATSLFANSFDSEHNRIWYRTPSGDCGLRSINIIGDRTETVSVDPGSIPKCLNSSAIDFPHLNFAVMGFQLDDQVTLARVDLLNKAVERIAFAPNKEARYQLLDLAAHSPDGKLECFLMRVMKKDRVGAFHDSGYRLAVVQVNPWKLLTTSSIPGHVNSVSSLAIEYFSGQAILEFWTGDRWTIVSREISLEKPN